MGKRRHLMILLAGLAVSALASEDALETLKVGDDTFTHVTIFNKTPTDIFFKHDGGFSNAKVKSLAPEVQKQLGYKTKEPDAPSRIVVNARALGLQVSPQVIAVKQEVARQVEATVGRTGQALLVGLLVGLLMGYFFFCYCCHLICKKAGQEPGVLVWLPILQMLPLMRAAGMSGWWFVMFLLPILNIVASVVWCFKIAQACGKTALTGVMLLLPVTSFFAFLYLAFSRSGEEEEEMEGPLKLA